MVGTRKKTMDMKSVVAIKSCIVGVNDCGCVDDGSRDSDGVVD